MPYPLTDGGAIGIYNITKSLAKRGHEITLVTYPLDRAEETRQAIEDISQFARVLTTTQQLPPRWKVLLRTVFRGAYPIERRMMPEMYEILEALMSREKFDIVHVDHAHMGRYGLWLKAKYGVPIVLREHNFESLIYERFAGTEKNPAKRFVARTHGKRLKIEEVGFLNRFDAVAAISEEDRLLMQQLAPNAVYRVIPAGVDTEYFYPSDSSVDPNLILSVGSFGWDPNFDAVRHFLKAVFPLVLKARPETVFEIVGAKGERIKPYAVTFGDSVRVLGLVPDIRDYLARAAVLVAPLRIGGGMRLKLLEFFASGKAVVSTSIGSEGNRARDGEHILLRDSDEAFADGIVRLLSVPEERETLGRKARALAITSYSWEGIAEEFTALYEEVLANVRTPKQ